MPNQYPPRNWKQEIIDVSNRLNLLVDIPEKLTAHRRIKFTCPHGITKETTILRFVDRQYCCKSQASKAHDRVLKQRAAMCSCGIKVREEHKKEKGILYLIRYLDKEGIHFKLGITMKTLEERFCRGELVSILDLYYDNLENCFNIEQQELKYARENGWRYSSHSTTELIRPEGVPHLLEVFSKLKT